MAEEEERQKEGIHSQRNGWMTSSASLGPCSLSHSQRSEQRWPCPHSACPVQLPPISSRLVAWERRGGTHTCTHTHTPHGSEPISPLPASPTSPTPPRGPRRSGEFSVMVTEKKRRNPSLGLSARASKGGGCLATANFPATSCPTLSQPGQAQTTASLGETDSCSGTCSALSGHRSRGWWGTDPNPGQH